MLFLFFIFIMIIILLQVVLVMADTTDNTDVHSIRLPGKDSEPTSESLSTMDVAGQTQEQSMDTSSSLEGSSGDTTQLKEADVNCGPEMACSKPIGTDTAESSMSCHSVPNSIDVQMKSSEEECSERVEISNQENANECDLLNEEEFRSVKKEENEESMAMHQSVDEAKSSVCETTEETEPLPAGVQPTAEEATPNDDTVHLAASSETTLPSGKVISN